MRTLLFHRQVAGYTGGHGKVLDYIRHAAVHPDWNSEVFVAKGSIESAENPFASLASRVSAWSPDKADALFLGGQDWLALDSASSLPVINLVQGVRHADPSYGLRTFLGLRAVRICVSQSVADAILATGEVHGPCMVIPAAVDTAAIAAVGASEPTLDVFIDAVKDPRLGEAVANRLHAAGMTARLHVERLPRDEYLRHMAAAKIVVTLPYAEEGFYLPGLEAMAMGRTLVQYDCLGSRDYLSDRRNARVPARNPLAITEAVLELHRDPHACQALASRAKSDARAFDLGVERARFHALLDDLDTLWEATN